MAIERMFMVTGDLGHDLDDFHRGPGQRDPAGAGVRPTAPSLLDPLDGTDELAAVHIVIGHRSRRLLLLAGQEQLLDSVSRLLESRRRHVVFMEILVLSAHTAHVQRDARLERVDGLLYIVCNADGYRPLDVKIRQGLAVLPFCQPFAQNATVLLHAIRGPGHGHPAVGDLGGHADVARRACSQQHGNSRVAVQNALERLPQSA
jgi:hypothetical protein